MPKAHELTGYRFNRLVAIEKAGKQGSHLLWRCLCDCGNTKLVTSNNLAQGRTGSCGCLAQEVTGNRARLHGLYGTPAHKSWRSMMDRCTNRKNPNYKHYGGKGITVCQRWAESFKHFHDDMGNRPSGMSIDRIDPNGNYEPSNCRWATNREQRMNQARSTISIEQAAEVRRLRELHGWGQNTIAKHLGISPGAAGGVIYLGNLAT